MPERRTQNLVDHDLLIRVDQKVDALSTDIKELKEGTASRLSHLEDDHVTRKEYGDHEKRLRFAERYIYGAIAIIGLVNLIGFAYIFAMLKH
jgi:hypothetical protein